MQRLKSLTMSKKHASSICFSHVASLHRMEAGRQTTIICVYKCVDVFAGSRPLRNVNKSWFEVVNAHDHSLYNASFLSRRSEKATPIQLLNTKVSIREMVRSFAGNWQVCLENDYF
jgi:hypothetical protein